MSAIKNLPADTLRLDSSPPMDSGLQSVVFRCASCDRRSAWAHLWRPRPGAIFEGSWTCSEDCAAKQIGVAVRRELEGRKADQANHRHRIPIGLVMLEQGWISREQLRSALNAQRSTGEGRLGYWLIDNLGIDEQLVTRALSLQWNCPVLSPVYHDADVMARMLPRLFVDAFETVPIRLAAGKILYLAFEERIDPVVALALERMMCIRVETGLARGSLFREAHQRQLCASFPKVELIEASSEAPLIRILAKTVVRTRAIDSRVVRIHDLLWMRMWLRSQSSAVPEQDAVQDVVCSLAAGWR